MLLYPSCTRRKLKAAVLSTPALNQAAQRIEETDLFRWQVYHAELINATGIMVNNSKQQVETNHGIKIGVDDCKIQAIEIENFWEIMVSATNDGGDRVPEDAT
jgi:hypothetical protein